MIALVTLALAGIVFNHARSNALAQRWAKKNGYRLIDAEYTLGLSGPFKWYRTAHGQSLIRVVVQDANGKRRIGTCGAVAGWPGSGPGGSRCGGRVTRRE